jgi:3-dehydro-L-gulonate 2-dehydrogenase
VRPDTSLRVNYDDVFATLERILLSLNFQSERARLCARLFTETSRDGVYSHGLNRFPQFVRMIKSEVVVANAQPQRVASFGALERWDGNTGVGNLNAWHCMERAITISREHGLGCVALANTNHWMRGGSYGWQAAEAGVIGICWSNTMPNLPPWGAAAARVGNNPLILAVPRSAGHVVLDMAMSQFSYGALANYRMRGEQLPLDGGFDSAGNLTRDPTAIEASQRPLPIGYWKGSGLALLLDMVGALLSGGRATHQITPIPERETKISQVFIAIDQSTVEQSGALDKIADEIIENFVGKKSEVRYPGQRVLRTRAENLAEGIPVSPQIWQEILAFQNSTA